MFEKLGRLFKQRLSEVGLSIKEVAWILDTTEDYLKGLEEGEIRPPRNDLLKILFASELVGFQVLEKRGSDLAPLQIMERVSRQENVDYMLDQIRPIIYADMGAGRGEEFLAEMRPIFDRRLQLLMGEAEV